LLGGCKPILAAGCVALATADGGIVGAGNILSATADGGSVAAGNVLTATANGSPPGTGNILVTAANGGFVGAGCVFLATADAAASYAEAYLNIFNEEDCPIPQIKFGNVVIAWFEDFGVFYKVDAGNSWQTMQSGLHKRSALTWSCPLEMQPSRTDL
jgi:hypothetical protein